MPTRVGLTQRLANRRAGLNDAVSAAIALLACLGAAAGCSSDEAEHPEEAGRDAGADAAAGSCRSLDLVASRTYEPAQWMDAEQNPVPELRFVLPERVAVVTGNAGNQWLTFTHSRGRNAAVSCRYNGGASRAHPSGAAEIALGRQYLFLSCTDGAVAGDVVTADHLSLHVDNGDSDESSTAVRMRIHEITPCAQPDAGVDSGRSDPGSDAGRSDAGGSDAGGSDAGSDSCVAGGAPLPVDDGNPCTDDACDPVAGVTHRPRPAGDPACSDGDACNGVETCDGAGACATGVPVPLDDQNACTVDGCDTATGPTHASIPNCDPTPFHADAPFEARASIMGRLVTRDGVPTGASFTVTDAPAEGAPPNAPRGDVSAAIADDGSFRLRLMTFPGAQSEGAPPVHVLLRVDAAGLLPVFRDAWLHTGTAADLGVIKMVPRDSASTAIGPAGGTANDSANRIQVVIPAGALDTTIDVVITPFDARDELPAPLPDSTVTMYGFELEPSGTTFNTPVTVRIANTEDVPTTFSIPTGFFDPSVGRWEHLAQATWDGARFAFTTTHFTTIDANARRGNGPGVGPSPGPPPAPPKDPTCGSGGGGGGGGPGDPPDPGPSPSPLGDIGSRATMTGGALSQSFPLPTYRVRNEPFGITLGYDSGLAGGRTQGAAPNDYQAVSHADHAVSVRGLRLSALCVPAATSAGGDRGAPTGRRPGVCAAQPSCTLGQAGGIPLRADFSWAGATTTQAFSMDASHKQADFAGFIDLPTEAGQVASPGLYATRVVVNAQSPGACVSSGGTFGVSDEQGAGTDLTVEPGPLATFDYHELINHRVSSPYGVGWTIEEYAEHRMTQKQSPRGDLTSYTFRPDGTLETSSKPGGQLTTVDAVLSRAPTYDANGNIVRAGSYTDGHGVAHEVVTNLRGDIEKDTYVADGVTRIEQAVYADGVFIRDGSLEDSSVVDQTMRMNRLFRVSHRTLNGVRLGPERKMWDAHFRPLTEFVAFASAASRSWIYTADGWLRAENRGAAWQVFERDSAGHPTRSYDSNLLGTGLGFPVTGAIIDTTYRPDGQVATRTEHTITRTYDYDDAPLGSANQLGWTDSIGQSMTYTLDANGNVIESTDGTATTYAAYDASDRVVETRDALNNTTTYGYAHAGCGCAQDNLVTSIHTPDLPTGSAWQMAYGSDSRLAAVTDPSGAAKSYAYAPTGELTKTTDELARDSVWTHDQLGRVLSMVDALGRAHASSHTVPASGAWAGPTLMAGSADATAAATSLTAVLRNGDYQIGHNGYLADGFPAAISFYRDATFELSFSHGYDRNERVVSRYDRTGLAIDSLVPAASTASYWNEQYSWNVLTPLPVLSAVGTSSADVGTRNSSYAQNIYFDDLDANGSGFEQMQELPTRDNAGRITRLLRAVAGTGTGASSTYAYRLDGRVSQIMNPDGTHDFTYDSRGLMQTQVVSDEGTYTYGYDALGRNNSLTYPDGHTRAQVYDELGRITSRCYQYPGPTTRCYGAEYDAVGNPIRMTDPDGADVFEYDALDRLKKVTREVGGVPGVAEEYAYNALGALKLNAGVALDDQRPRLSGGGNADAAVPASVGGLPVVLNPGGRVTSLRGTTFKWSGDGALREVVPPPPAAVETYGIDAYGRRFSRAVAGAVVEYYIYEGLDRIATVGPNGRDPNTGFSIPGPVIETYLFDGIDHPLRIKVAATDTTAYYELDLAGNVRALRASGGTSLGGYRYSAFGQTVEETASVTQPLQWKGRWYSPIAGGIYDVRARPWSPEMGAFLGIDEYEYHDTTSTLWGWPHQNPVRWADSSGRGPVEIITCLLHGGTMFTCALEEIDRARDALGGGGPPSEPPPSGIRPKLPDGDPGGRDSAGGTSPGRGGGDRDNGLCQLQRQLTDVSCLGATQTTCQYFCPATGQTRTFKLPGTASCPATVGFQSR